MRSRFWILGVAFAMLAASLFSQTKPVSNQYQHINSTWNAPNSTYPDCSTTVTKDCLSSYTFSATDPFGASTLVTVPNGGIAAGGLVAYNWTPGSFLYCGGWTVSVVTNYIDDVGAGASSSAATVPATVSCPLVASPATNLKVTVAP